MNKLGLKDFVGERIVTYPSRLPLTQLDYVYARGLKPVGVEVPRGRIGLVHVGHHGAPPNAGFADSNRQAAASFHLTNG